jgi:hypothetical protein
MSRYICFTNLKHLIFWNRGSNFLRQYTSVCGLHSKNMCNKVLFIEKYGLHTKNRIICFKHLKSNHCSVTWIYFFHFRVGPNFFCWKFAWVSVKLRCTGKIYSWNSEIAYFVYFLIRYEYTHMCQINLGCLLCSAKA